MKCCMLDKHGVEETRLEAIYMAGVLDHEGLGAIYKYGYTHRSSRLASLNYESALLKMFGMLT
jgi:hypothetical protein